MQPGASAAHGADDDAVVVFNERTALDRRTSGTDNATMSGSTTATCGRSV
jgi:hypothetical protein